jgi:hypothetical protein
MSVSSGNVAIQPTNSLSEYEHEHAHAQLDTARWWWTWWGIASMSQW